MLWVIAFFVFRIAPSPLMVYKMVYGCAPRPAPEPSLEPLMACKIAYGCSRHPRVDAAKLEFRCSAWRCHSMRRDG